MEIKPIAHIKNDYDDKFGVPRQSNIASEIKSKIIFCDKYAKSEAIKGLDGFSHIWLIWEFSKNSHPSSSLTVRPPRLGGNERVGVFASRSPFRPNPIGLSSVRLEEVVTENNKPVLIVSGADLVNGTPIYDIKPYIKYSDSHEDAVCGFADEREFNILKVDGLDKFKDRITDEQYETITKILSNDPRPAYQRECDRMYGFKFGGKEIKFRVKGNVLTVTEIKND